MIWDMKPVSRADVGSRHLGLQAYSSWGLGSLGSSFAVWGTGPGKATWPFSTLFSTECQRQMIQHEALLCDEQAPLSFFWISYQLLFLKNKSSACSLQTFPLIQEVKEIKRLQIVILLCTYSRDCCAGASGWQFIAHLSWSCQWTQKCVLFCPCINGIIMSIIEA